MLSHCSLFSTIFFSCLLTILIVQGAKPNICGWIHCENKGTCQQYEQSPLGFQCQCEIGFNGLLCENRVNISSCGANPCLNGGNCTIAANRTLICTCPKTYSGVRCEKKI